MDWRVAMTSGGARPRSGPPPQPDSLRRDRDSKDWTKLPKECTIPAPDWPLEIPEPTITELSMWTRLWKMPQAHVWHADHTADLVGLYVRSYVRSVKPDAPSSSVVVVKQMGDHLLLSTPALFAGRYVITGSPEDEILSGQALATKTRNDSSAGGRRPRSAGRGSSARDRLPVSIVPDPEPEPDESEDE
jgi:hypothetical protein